MRKIGLALVSAAALHFAPRTARAAAASTRPIAESLDVGSIPCLDRESLAVQVRAWLRRDQIDSRLSVVVRPGPDDSGQTSVAFYILRDGQPVVERLLPHVDVACDQLRAAVGLAIAISVETTMVKVAEETPASPATEAPAPSAPDVPRADVTEERRFSFGLRLVGAPALLPRPSAAGSAELSARILSLLEANASVMATSPVTVELGQGSADLRLVAGRLDGCMGRRYGGRLASRACLGASIGRLIADASGYAVSYSPRLTWAAAIIRLEASLTVATGFRLALGMDGVLPFVVPKLEVRSPSEELVATVTMPEFGAMVFAGPQVDF